MKYLTTLDFPDLDFSLYFYAYTDVVSVRSGPHGSARLTPRSMVPRIYILLPALYFDEVPS